MSTWPDNPQLELSVTRAKIRRLRRKVPTTPVALERYIARLDGLLKYEVELCESLAEAAGDKRFLQDQGDYFDE